MSRATRVDAELRKHARTVRIATAELRAQGMSLAGIGDLTGHTATAVNTRLHRHRAYVKRGTDPRVEGIENVHGSLHPKVNQRTVRKLQRAYAESQRLMAECGRIVHRRAASAREPEPLTPTEAEAVERAVRAQADAVEAEAALDDARARRYEAIRDLIALRVPYARIGAELGMSASSVHQVYVRQRTKRGASE